MANGTVAPGYAPYPIPTLIPSMKYGYRAIAAGENHSCALSDGGEVVCWGNNAHGQLGTGSTSPDKVPEPVKVVGLPPGIIDITVGFDHSCVLTAAGGVMCWGINDDGQLGDGTNDASSVPKQVSGLTSGVASIEAGAFHTCALTTGGAMRCWGCNWYGTLGDSTNNSKNTPSDVTGLSSGVKMISAGWHFSCAINSANAALCWGVNNYWQLGDGTKNDKSSPNQVPGLTSGVRLISAGYYQGCAHTTANQTYCWGWNPRGQLGDGTIETRTTPVLVSTLTASLGMISADVEQTCAVTTDDEAYCWGLNDCGQIGDGNIEGLGVWVPTKVINFP